MMDQVEQPSEEPTMTPANEIASVMGGLDVPVQYRDGKAETVKVRELGADLMQRYALMIGDESKCADLFCDRPDGWSKTLSRESFTAVMDAGQDLNLDFFVGWFRRSMKRAEATNPGIKKVINDQLIAAIASSSLSQDSSLRSPSGPASM